MLTSRRRELGNYIGEEFLLPVRQIFKESNDIAFIIINKNKCLLKL